MKNVILIGDSIRMGYLPFAARELENTAQVWGPEINGGTSRNILAHLDEWALARDSDLIHLNCGLHDLARDPDEHGHDGNTRVPIAEYENNVREILSRIQKADKKIVWATTTPVHEINHKAKGFERRETDVEAYNAIARGVAQQLGVPINDLNRVVNEAGRARVLLPDGVHYADDGSALLGHAVAQFVRALL